MFLPAPQREENSEREGGINYPFTVFADGGMEGRVPLPTTAKNVVCLMILAPCFQLKQEWTAFAHIRKESDLPFNPFFSCSIHVQKQRYEEVVKTKVNKQW